MPNTTRSKFRCIQISQFADTETKQIKLVPVNRDIPENKEFWRATPIGSIEMSITNPVASSLFETGVEYFVDFTVAKPS